MGIEEKKSIKDPHVGLGKSQGISCMALYK